jgi:energy-coupling factor transporter ATP-binding protein EcfA2
MYGPNGIGKTKLLEILSAAIQILPVQLARIPFDEAVIHFEGATLTVKYVPPDSTLGPEGPFRRGAVSFNLQEGGKDWPEWVAHPYAQSQPWTREDFWTEIRPGVWRDSRDGETVGEAELWERYTPRSRSRRTLGMRDGELLLEVPNYLRQFRDSLSVHFIKTQRLQVDEQASDLVDVSFSGERPLPRDALTVESYAFDLKRRLSRALAENSRTTQQLDRSFPRRILLDEQDMPEINDEKIRRRYNEQNRLRKRLASISLIATEFDLPLPERNLESFERRVLWTYLTDTEEKLATFQSILDKVSLLRELLNSRLLQKELVVNVEQGMLIRRTTDGHEIRLRDLSSGEQHELILMYFLLFNIDASRSLVLIDEPEISLHVVWQQRFLEDLIKISELASAQFVIATHSPQIVGKWWDRTVELSPDI